MDIFFLNLDIGWRSYELFSLPKSSYPRLVVLYSFLLLKNASWYPFKFLPSLILEPFISRFILRHLSIQRICNSLFLRTKIDFTFSPPSCLLSKPFMLSLKKKLKKLLRLMVGYRERSINTKNISNCCVRKNPVKR